MNTEKLNSGRVSVGSSGLVLPSSGSPKTSALLESINARLAAHVAGELPPDVIPEAWKEMINHAQAMELDRNMYLAALQELTDSSTKSDRDHQPSRAVMVHRPQEPSWTAWDHARCILQENVQENPTR